MKETVSVKELKAYVERNKPRRITFCTENQWWYSVLNPFKLEFSFVAMSVYENPNLICLRSGDNTMCFSRVKCVEIDTEDSVLGTILTIFCGENRDSWHEATYNLIIS